MIKKVVFICGAGHSGSTLLGLLLGSHSKCFYLGEANKVQYLYNTDQPEKRRYCKVCGAECKVWKEYSQKNDNEYDIYTGLEKIIENEVVIDSSKELNWLRGKINFLSSRKDREIYLIYLKRDGRAVINSRLRKQTDSSYTDIVQQWIMQVQDTNRIYNEFDGFKTIVPYHKLTKEPERVLRELCNVLNIGYEDRMLHFYEEEHHPLGGNNGTQFLLNRVREKEALPHKVGMKKAYFASHPQKVKHDNRWKLELPEEARLVFAKLASELNESFREE